MMRQTRLACALLIALLVITGIPTQMLAAMSIAKDRDQDIKTEDVFIKPANSGTGIQPKYHPEDEILNFKKKLYYFKPSPQAPDPQWVDAPVMDADIAEIGQPFRECEQCPVIVRIKQQHPDGFRFAMVYELTYANYLAAVKEADCAVAVHMHGKPWTMETKFAMQMMSGKPSYSLHSPVMTLRYGQFICYQDWLEEKTGHRYRRPTVEEWTWLAYGDGDTLFPWGNEPGYNQAVLFGYFDQKKYAPYNEWRYSLANQNWPRVVGQFKPNIFGLYDVIGNVFELTSDCIDDKALEIATELMDSAERAQKKHAQILMKYGKCYGAWAMGASVRHGEKYFENKIRHKRDVKLFVSWPRKFPGYALQNSVGFRLIRD